MGVVGGCSPEPPPQLDISNYRHSLASSSSTHHCQVLHRRHCFISLSQQNHRKGLSLSVVYLLHVLNVLLSTFDSGLLECLCSFVSDACVLQPGIYRCLK